MARLPRDVAQASLVGASAGLTLWLGSATHDRLAAWTNGPGLRSRSSSFGHPLLQRFGNGQPYPVCFPERVRQGFAMFLHPRRDGFAVIPHVLAVV